jgi:predicted dehydrogenase
MGNSSIGVAVIGAGMAGRAHVSGYRAASTMFDSDLPDVRLVAVADAHKPFAVDAAMRYGYERAETSWESIVDAPDVDAVSVVVANDLHRPIVEALLVAGKHVLCEKPLAPTVADAEAMVEAAEKSDLVAAVGFTFRRSPAINAIRQQITDGTLGKVMHFNGHYWCDYGFNKDAPMSWRYRGAKGSGALSDIGSHLIDLGEFLSGPVESVRGSVLSTLIPDRPIPLGTAVGHAATVALSETRAPVENEDVVTFTATFKNGTVGTFSVSRVAYGLPNGLGFEVFCEGGPLRSTWPGQRSSASPTAHRQGSCSRHLPSSSRSPASTGFLPYQLSPTACTTSGCSKPSLLQLTPTARTLRCRSAPSANQHLPQPERNCR